MIYLFLPLLAVVLTLLFSAYLRYASARLAMATKLWPLVEQSASKLISDKVPAGVREIAYRLGVTTGCGCYAFGIILHHYLPDIAQRLFRERPADEAMYKAAVDMLDATQKRQLDTLIGAALSYDMLAHPILGYFAQRTIQYRVPVAPKA